MAGIKPEVMAAIRRKLNITWDAAETDERLKDVVDSVSPVLAKRLGYANSHAFSSNDGEAWPLFLNACLYEFSDALDDFWKNYAEDIRACRSLVTLPKKGSNDGAQD
ncbi:hypothetical protein [Atopobium fossor]|uniref:hypothetical protein n=1 Tax=Atopobium fossor TaxID=39487 RepID=UPI000486E7DB|nr:hypothetical protein [Atopobium fossor]